MSQDWTCLSDGVLPPPPPPPPHTHTHTHTCILTLSHTQTYLEIVLTGPSTPQDESIGAIEVCVALNPISTTVVTLQTMDGSAVGKCYCTATALT